MKKYTANYAFTNPNFVIQNLNGNPIKSEYLSVYFVVKNLLQRGFPTILSKYLQDKIGKIHERSDFKEPFLLIDTQTPIWYNTIKGDTINNYFPAKTFFEQIIPQYFNEYTFVQSLILPEAEINDLTGEHRDEFVNQKVDFFLPPAKLVIEIDGQHHKVNDVTRVKDHKRDDYLKSKGIKTVRITTNELKNGTFKSKINEIIKHFKHFDENKKILLLYKNAYEKIKNNLISNEEYQFKLLPTAIIRFQILVLELLINGRISLNDEVWRFCILERDVNNFASLAIEDLFLWIKNLCQLRKLEFKKPEIEIKTYQNEDNFIMHDGFIHIDFSLFKRYTDENELYPNKIFVRTDYFTTREKNYFKVSTCDPVKYKIVSDNEEDKSALRFFLQNIFEKHDFRDGQFPIIVNALQLNDTIGLLPTGAGKSICYQLACLLQPSINFVVCPLKSLMCDQQDNLNNSLITNINFITSDLTSDEKDKIQHDFSQGKFLFIFVSPERFQNKNFREYLSSVNAHFSIAYAVIDEVHCLSEWGHDFRTSYLNLVNTIRRYCPKIKFIGLTATASVNVLKDIKVEFGIRDENIKTLLDYSRKELYFEVINDKGQKWELLTQKLDELKQNDGFLDHSTNAGLIFTPHVNGDFGCYKVYERLNTIYKDKVKWYSGEVPKLSGMNNEAFKKYKNDVQGDFKKNEFSLMVATKAFGMGIDKQNIHYTFHYGLPSSVEALYQEAGRAGRWDKNEPANRDKKAKCFVLFSPETIEKQLIDEIFKPDTKYTRIKEINDKVGKQGKDIFRIIILFLSGQKDIKEYFTIIKFLIEKYFKPKNTIKIYWNDVKRELKVYSQKYFNTDIDVNEDITEKCIYKLSLLGIVKDWTTDFATHYEVEFDQLSDESVLENLEKYIHKYEPLTDVKIAVQSVRKPTIIDKCIWYLLQWSWENIMYTRRQSLKTLYDWCLEFDNSEAFKARIDAYFKFTETTFIIQHIAENPKEFEKWFELFYSEGKLLNKKEMESLKDSLSRFLESYRSNVGLNLISGFIRLFLNEYQDTDGKSRLENAISQFKNLFSSNEQEIIIQKMIDWGMDLTEENKYELAKSIIKFYPEKIELLAEKFDVPYLLADLIEEKLKTFKTINQQFYEQITKI